MTRVVFRSLVLFVLCLSSALAVFAAPPVVRTINGNPLTVLVGDDTSFQVLNSTIGTLGQIYPGGCTNSVADSGVFAIIGGVLYAPNYGQHTCSTATGGIGLSTPWTPVSISAVSGAGTTTNPFAVTVVADAGTSGVRLTATYTYVNGEPFFRITKVFSATAATAINVYLAADIYLGGSDFGIPYLEPLSHSPGGKECGTGTYTILLIPTTPADHYDALAYFQIWNTLGLRANLSDTVATGCMDNGAGIQWLRNIPAGGSTTITSAVSFGPIPPIVQFNVASASPAQACRGRNGVTVVLTGTGFQSGTTFNFGPGITVTSTTINSATQATVTLNISSTAATGPRNVIGTQSTGGLTATLVNGFTVTICEECGRMLDPRVLCTTDGTGDYLITFTFQNLSTQPVQHLYFGGLPGGVTATPSAVHLSSPVAPSGTVSIGPIRIHGAPPGPLTMTIDLLSPDFAYCCSFDVRFELPQCNCAQVVDETRPSCNATGTAYTYTFAYQNLFHGQISELLITPDSPAGAVFTPSLVPLNPPMNFGEIRPITITVSAAASGQPLCFHITSMTEEDEHCCTIRHCVFLPRCTEIDPTGDTNISDRNGQVTLTSDDGRPGCIFPLAPNTTSFDLTWLPITEALPAASYVEQRYRGTVDGGDEAVIASTRTVVGSVDSELRTSFDALGATQYRYEFLNDGRLVGTQSGVPSNEAPICNGCGGHMPTRDAHFTIFGHLDASEESQPDCFEQGFPCLFAGYTFQDPVALQFRQAATKYFADEVRVFPENGEGEVIDLTAVEFQAQGPHTITFTEISATVDCNGNGLDDFADIAAGTSLDLDRNGIPDECQRPGGALDLSLSTGFDQRRGTLLGGGADDDDWRLLNTGIAGAAKVVTAPPAAWGSALAQSAWISVDASAVSRPSLTTLQFENCFCIAGGASSATLDLDVRADNGATVFLNDAQVGSGGAFNGAPLAVHVTGGVGGNGPFRTGRNCVRVHVQDFGGLTGLDVAGRVRAANGACPD